MDQNNPVNKLLDLLCFTPAGLIALAVLYTGWLIRSSRHESSEIVAEFDVAFTVDPMRARGTWPACRR